MRLALIETLEPSEIKESFGLKPYSNLAIERLKELGVPTRAKEAYRYFDIEPLMEHNWQIATPSSKEIKQSRDSIIIEDGVVVAIPDGVSVGCGNTIDLDNSHFDSLYYMGHILANDIILIRFKSDAKVKIIHKINSKDTLIAYRIALYIDSNTRIQIEERFESNDANGSLLLSGYDAFIARDASLKLIKSQTLTINDYTPLLSHRFKVDTQATLDFKSYDFGSGNGLQLFKVELHKYANLNASHLLYLNGSPKRGTISQIIHIQENSTSSQIAKNILDDKSRGIFDALIKVENSAKYTKAHQNSKAILLKDGAYMASKPQLEIYIDELEASHGSTTGQLDEAQLFYLRSRGIAKDEAKKMLILGFANELIDSIDDKSLREQIHLDFERAYYGESKISCIETCHNCEEMILGGN